MNESDYMKLREEAWRRPLTAGEKSQLQSYLLVHAEAQAEWEEEAALTQLLARAPDAPLSSNFTARIMQAMFLPVIAVAFAVAPIVGQNFGGRRADRVRQSFYSALGITCGLMVLLTILSQLAAGIFIRGFSNDPSVIVFGSEYLQIISLNFVAMGIVFTSSSVFQGIGNTWPPLISSATRLFLFALPAVILSRLPDFHIKQVWYLSVASVLLQACINLLLLRREFKRKLVFPADGSIAPITGSASPA